jgi:hypothetical protein
MKRQYLIYIVFYYSFFLNSDATLIARNSGGDNEYDVKKIPASLLKDADAVIRTNIIRFEVKNKRHAMEKVKRAVTIFKKEERHYGELILGYDKFHEIEDLEGKIYDAQGERIRKLSDDDIKDYCDFTEYSLFSDSRVRTAELFYDQYPYTIEYTYEYSYNGYINWPTWWSQISLDPIEQNRFEVIIPKEDSLRYWCNSDSIQPSITLDGSKRLYVWESRNLPKLSKDVVGEDAEDVATTVCIAPSLFEYGDYPGDMRTWKDFGKWDHTLTAGRDILPASAIADIHSLLKTTDDTLQKIKKIYRYMQDRTRYVSIKLGIGGWQPFDATYVHERGYGDCKALSNYMVALLKEAGITCYAVDILPGDQRFPFIQEFPSANFTHVIACVPLETDTVWLECTSQSIPFGHISYKNENRGALLLSPDGGVVVRTPQTVPRQNRQQQRATVELTALGNANASVLVASSGNQQDHLREALNEANPQDRERWILYHLGIPNLNLKNYKLDGLETHELEITLTAQLELPRYASRSGDRLFFLPNLMERQTYIPAQVTQRLSPIRYNYPYLNTDSIIYSLPKGFSIESIPKEIHFKTSFGEYYSRTVAINDTAIIYQRSMEIHDYSIPAEKYAEYRQFYSDIVKADRAQVVLVRKN